MGLTLQHEHASSPCAIRLLFEAGSFREAVDKTEKKDKKKNQQMMASVLRQLGRQQIYLLERPQHLTASGLLLA